MPANELNGRWPVGGATGFHSYADDTPRGADDGLLPDDRHPTDAGRRRFAWGPVTAGTAAALALGAGALVALDQASLDATKRVSGEQLPVEVAEITPPKPPPVSESTPLVVLPDLGGRPTIDLAPDVPPPAPRVRAEPATSAEPDLPVVTERAEPRTPSFAVTGLPASAAVIEPPRRDPCAEAPSLAAQMVCRDPALAAADRRMRRAYDEALAAGVPAEILALEQSDWRDIREMAAQRSPRAVASIYRQRTDELRMMADGAWR